MVSVEGGPRQGPVSATGSARFATMSGSATTNHSTPRLDVGFDAQGRRQHGAAPECNLKAEAFASYLACNLNVTADELPLKRPTSAAAGTYAAVNEYVPFF